MRANYNLSEGSSLILDLIRGISAQLVVYGHGALYCGVFIFPFFYIQNIAVAIFFIISGFVITYSTINKVNSNSNFSFKQYLIDRFSRVYTTFIPSIIFVLLLDFLSKNISPDLYAYNSAYNFKTFVGNIFMLQDFPFTNHVLTSFGSARPFWTLAVEWWIYIFFGYLLLMFFKAKNNLILNFLIFTFLLIVPSYNLIGGRGNGLMLTWFYGVIIYFFASSQLFKNNIKFIYKFYILVLISFLFLIRIYIIRTEYDPILTFILAVMMFLLIDFFSNFNFNRFFKKIIRYNASYSFTLYLIHYSIFDFMVIHFKESINKYILFFVGFIISNILSIIVGRYTEIKLTRIVKNILYKKFNITSN